jgi:hypothetical protein
MMWEVGKDMNKTFLCLLSFLLLISIIQIVHCVIESEVMEELPMDYPAPELPTDIPEPIKAESIEPFRSPDGIYTLRE